MRVSRTREAPKGSGRNLEGPGVSGRVLEGRGGFRFLRVFRNWWVREFGRERFRRVLEGFGGY